MQFNRKGKKDNDNSRNDSLNASVHSGLNVDTFRPGRETTGRKLGRAEDLNKSTTESGYKEVLYLDANDRRLQNMSPGAVRQTGGMNYNSSIRSPNPRFGQGSIISSVRNDLKGRPDTASIVGKKPIPTLKLEMPAKKESEEYERSREASPVVISMAGNSSDAETYGTKTLNQRRSPKDTVRQSNIYGVNSYGTNQDSSGNLLVDQPVNVLGSFIQGGEYSNNKSNNQRSIDPREKTREIQFSNIVSNNYIDVHLKNKMSPNRNVNDNEYLDKNDEFYENSKVNRLDKIRKLNKMIEFDIPQETYSKKTNNVRQSFYNDYTDDIENLMQMKQVNRSPNKDFKKLEKQLNIDFNTNKREGRLFNKQTNTSSPINNDELFPDRRTVLMRMNKLSHILKSRSADAMNKSMEQPNNDLNNSRGISPNQKTNLRDGRSVGPSHTDLRKTFADSRSPQQKFIRVSMAMLSSKGPNCEDRIITRVMRYEKGGVVDLHQNQKKNNKYQIKKVGRQGEKAATTHQVKRYTPKDRERASKVMQAWWREILNRYKNLNDKILRIQKVWRGHFLRTYLYDILTSSIITQLFIDRLKKPLVKDAKATGFNALFPFAQLYFARKNLRAIIKIQGQCKKFLDRLRDKRSRMGLLLDKILIRRKKQSLDKINIYANNSSIREQKKLKIALDLLQKIKKAMRVRIFHDLLKQAYNRPVNKLKSTLFHNMLRGGFRRSRKLLLREWFMKWLKKSFRKKPTPELLGRLANPLLKTIMKHRLNDFLKCLKLKNNREKIKSKVLKRLIGKAGRYRDIFLKMYWKRWLDVNRSISEKEFAQNVSSKLTVKFMKKMEKNNLARRFRLWRVEAVSKRDIQPYHNGFDHLRNHYRRRIYNLIMPINTIEGAKNRLVKGLMKNSKNFTKVPLRHYLNKWKKILSNSRKSEYGARLLNALGRKNFKFMCLRLLRSKFNLWKLKVKQLNYLDKQENKREAREREQNLKNLIGTLRTVPRKFALKDTIPKIGKYASELTLSEGAKKIMQLNPKLSRLLLRRSWNKWKDNANKLKLREMRNRFFYNIANGLGSKLKNKYLRKFFNKWNKTAPKNSILRQYKAADSLLNKLRKKYINSIINAFAQKIDLENAKDGVKKAFNMKNRFIQRHWREYLLKWRKICNKLGSQSLQNNLSAKLMNKFVKSRKNEILRRSFIKWYVTKPKFEDMFIRYKGLGDIVEKSINKNLKVPAKTFFNNFKKHTGEFARKKAMRIFADYAINGQTKKLNDFFDKWRLKTKDHEIHELKLKLLRWSVGQQGIKNRKMSLSSAFYKWIQKYRILKSSNDKDRAFIVYTGGDLLGKLKLRRMNDFMIRLHKKMNRDPRGKFYLNIFRKLLKPRKSVESAFEKWRRVKDNMDKEDMENNFKSSLFKSSCKKVSSRLNRDNLSRAFAKFKLLLRKPQDYYEKILEGTNKTMNYLKSKCKPAFKKIAENKNYKKFFLDVLPVNSKIKARAEKNSKLRLWNKWKKVITEDQKKDFRDKLFNKLGKNLSKRRQLNQLAWGFHKWWNFKRPSLSFPSVIKGSDIILDNLKKRYRRPIFDQLIKNREEKAKNSGLSLLFGRSKTFQKNKLHKFINLWWKKSLYNDEEIKNRVVRNMKRYVIDNYIMGPLEKYWRRWLKNMIQKPRDFNNLINGTNKLKIGVLKKNLKNFFKNLSNTVSTNYVENKIIDKLLPKVRAGQKKNLSHYLNKWRKKADAIQAKQFTAKFLNSLYGKGKEAMKKRWLKSYFNKWSKKPKVKPPVDLSKVIEGENIIFKTLANKYLKGFLPDARELLNNRFLKSMLNRNSKFHRKALQPFVQRWREKANKMKNDEYEADLVSRYMLKIKKTINKRSTLDLMRKKFIQWKNKNKEIAEFNVKSAPFLLDILRKQQIRRMFPFLTKAMKSGQKKNQRPINKKTARLMMEFKKKYLLADLNRAFSKLKDNSKDSKFDELRHIMMKKHLKSFSRNYDKNKLQKAFFFWKGKQPKNITAIKVGTMTLNKLLTRKPYFKLKSRLLRLPAKLEGKKTLLQALMKANPSIAKTMVMSHLLMRPYLKRWVNKSRDEKIKEIKSDIFKKMVFPQIRNKGKLASRHYFNKWKNAISEQDKMNAIKNLRLKISRNIFDKNGKLFLIRKFNLWRDLNRQENEKLYKISKGIFKINNRMNRHAFHNLITRLNQLNDSKNKFLLVKKMMVNTFRNNDKGNLLFCFRRWVDRKNSEREKQLKHKIIQALLRKKIGNTEEINKNSLHESLLRWRIRAAPKDYYDTMNRIRVGCHTLHKGMTKDLNGLILSKLRNASKIAKVKRLMYEFISEYDSDANKFILQNRFNFWRQRLGDKDILTKRLRYLSNQYINALRPELVKQPISDLTECMRAWMEMKKNKAGTIQDYCRNLLLILQRMKAVQRNRNLHKIFSTLSMKDAVKVRLLFARWMKNANLINAQDKAKIIQNFLRGKKNALTAKRANVQEGLEHMDKYVKLKSMKKIRDEAIARRKRQLFVRLLPDIPAELRKQFLDIYMKRWRKVIIKGREDAAALLITTVLRGFLTRKFKNLLLKRKARLNNISLKLFGKHLDKRRLYFNKWLLDNRRDQIAKAGQVIDAFLRPRLLNLKKARAMIRLYELLKHSFVDNVVKSIKKASRINGDRGLILYDTLKNIYIQRPFDKLKEGSTWIGRLKRLHNVYPIITEALRKYWLPHYMRKWKAKTYDDKIRRIVQLQNWYKARILLWRARCHLRKTNLTQKFMTKMTKDNNLKLKLALRLWNKMGKYTELNRKASAVQSLWRGNTARKNADKLLNCKKMNDLFKKALLKKINQSLVKCSDFIEPLKKNLLALKSGLEKRYPTNNLMNVANNKLRSALIHRLSRNADKNEYDYNIRRTFDRLKYINRLANESAMKAQNKFREIRAKRKRDNLKLLKQKMTNVFLKYDTTEMGKLKSALHVWNCKANAMKVLESAKTIQNYTRKKYAKLLNDKFKSFFKKNSEKLVKSRLNNASKVNNLKRKLQKLSIRPVIEKLRYNQIREKVVFILGKKFSELGDQLKGLYLKKYFHDWRHNSNQINNKEHASAVAILSLFKGHLARKFVARLRDKKNKLRLMMLRLTRDSSTQKEIIFRLWNNKANALKLTESARTIQNYLANVKKKSDNIKTKSKNKKYTDAYDVLAQSILPKVMGKLVLQKIKSQANRNLLKKVADNVENKKRNHLTTAVDAISRHAFNQFALKNKGAKMIQNRFLHFRIKKRLYDLLNKISRLRFILRLMTDRKARMLHKSMRIWRRNALGDKFQDAAKTIQNFLDTKVLKYGRDKKDSSVANIHRIVRKYLIDHQLRPYFKDFATATKLEKFKKLMTKHIFDKFRKNIDQYEMAKCFDGVFGMRKAFIAKILRKRFLEWNRKAKAIKENWAAFKIIKALRNYIQRNRTNLIKYKTRNIFMRLAARYIDIRKLTLNLWSRNAQIIKVEDHARIIQDFVLKNFERQKAKKKWSRLANKLFSRNRYFSGIDLFQRYKQFKGINLLFDFADSKLKKEGFKDFLLKSKNHRILNLCKLIFSGFKDRNSSLAKYYYFRRWKMNKAKMELKESHVEKLVGLLELRRLKDGFNRVGNAIVMKSLFNLIDQIRGKMAFKKIKRRAVNKEKVRAFGKKLIEAEDDLVLKNKEIFANKLYKIYTYKTLCNLNKTLDRIKNQIKPQAGKNLMKILKAISVAESKDNYNRNTKHTSTFQPKEYFFQAQVHNTRKLHNLLSKKDPSNYVVPFMGKFFNALINKRIRWAMDKLINTRRAGKMFEVLYKAANRMVNIPKKNFFGNLLNISNYIKQTPEKMANLFQLFRRYFLHRLNRDLHPISKQHRIMYLVRVVFMNREISSKRFVRELIRRWRFLIYMKKLAKQKLEAMYKNMHINYLNMAKEVFGDGEGEFGMIREFENFGNSIGMFTNIDVEDYEEGKKKFFKQVTKRYQFEPFEVMHNEGEEVHYDDFSLVRDKNSLLADNTEYYYDEGIGDATQGRYKVDTNKSQSFIENVSKEQTSKKKK